MFIKGILVGLIYGLPFGALGAIVVSRTLKSGTLSGLLTGLGSSLAAMIYAYLGLQSNYFMNHIFKKYGIIINCIGGIIIILLGIMTIKKEIKEDNNDHHNYLSSLFSGFTLAIMNPSVILLYVFAMQLLKIHHVGNINVKLILLLGVFIGTLLWWIIICPIIGYYKTKITNDVLLKINKILGILLIILGVSTIIMQLI